MDRFATADGHDRRSIWVVPAAIAAVALIIFLTFFKDRRKPTVTLLDELEATIEAPGTTVPRVERPQSA